MSKSDISYRASQKRQLKCTVPGCDDHRHGVSAYCDVHTKRRERTGSPTGSSLKHRELAPFVKQAQDFLITNAEHSAIKETIANIEHWFTTAASCVSTAKSNSYDHRCIRELARLRRDEDVTGEKVLTIALAIFMLTQVNPERLAPLSREHRFALSRSVLKMTTMVATLRVTGNGGLKKNTARLSTVLLDRFGLALLEETVSLCSRIAATLKQKERDDYERRARLAAALETPFV